ncbi:MAG: hypothetical protein HY401_09285 [Elusimicrobia bacterium]|nr:hypothetical protein [Elusimicrobiota bacterium]
MRAVVNLQKIEDWLYDNGLENGLKDRALAGPLAVCAAIFLLSVIWMQQSAASIGRVRGAVAALQAKSQLVGQYQNLTSTWSQVTRRGVLVAADQDPQQWIASQLSSYANDTGMEIVASNPGQSVNLGPLKRHEKSFSLRGRYDNLGRLLAKLESNRPFIGISRLNISKTTPSAAVSGANDKTFGLLSVEVSVFTLTENSEGAAAGSRP